MTTTQPRTEPDPLGVCALVARLRAIAIPALARMYRPHERRFVFRLRRTELGIQAEGLSRRYTAIVLLGLRNEPPAVVREILGPHSPEEVCAQLVADAPQVENLGDVALTLWAARRWGMDRLRAVYDRLRALRPVERSQPSVELAWVLSALSADLNLPEVREQRDLVAARLLSCYDERSRMFPHVTGQQGFSLRGHVSCFADLVYPTQALALFSGYSGSAKARDAARRCAENWAGLQGAAGQWWWHYDYRTGRVLEPYPVYAVHQNSMAPMALFAVEDVTDLDFTDEIALGLRWLAQAPELNGHGLIDEPHGVIWRKVGRREPPKLARRIQGLASRLHPAIRVPGMNVLMPPVAIDHEFRPYHPGWLMFAFPPERLARWKPVVRPEEVGV